MWPIRQPVSPSKGTSPRSTNAPQAPQRAQQRVPLLRRRAHLRQQQRPPAVPTCLLLLPFIEGSAQGLHQRAHCQRVPLRDAARGGERRGGQPAARPVLGRAVGEALEEAQGGEGEVGVALDELLLRLLRLWCALSD